MRVRINSSGSHHAALTVEEDRDGVNAPAAVSLYVHTDGHGELSVHLVGGDPDFEDEDTDKPTIVEASYHGDTRKVEIT